MAKVTLITDLLQANIRASEGAGTTTLLNTDNRHQIFNLSAARTCVLPSFGIVKGEKIRLESIGAFDLTVQSSDTTTITAANAGVGSFGDPTIRNGYVELIALQDIPTSPSHWMVKEVYERFSYTTTWTWNGSGATSTSRTNIVIRHNKQINIYVEAVQANTGTNSTIFKTNTAPPSRIQGSSGNQHQTLIDRRHGGTAQTSPCILDTETDGQLAIRTLDNGTFPNSTNVGFGTFANYAVLNYILL